MTHLTLNAGWEKLAPETPFAQLNRPPLYHQVRTLEALRQHHLVMNSYNTGTGKTFASLLHLFDLHEHNQTNPHQPKNVLFIAPTNALIHQHQQDIETFVTDHGLDFKVVSITAPDIRALESGLRPGETLYRRLSNYLEFEEISWEQARRRPLVVVINPDIFYYALYFRYQTHDRRNVFMEFVKKFDYLVVDEFHYYNNKQLANFLFAFALFKQLKYFDEGRRKICLLSATPDERVRDYLDRLFGAHGWAEISPETEPAGSEQLEQVPALTPLSLTIQAVTIDDWARANIDHLTGMLFAHQKHGALISGSLARISHVYHALKSHLDPERTMGRITGPEPQAKRLQATARPLILATPTVDIGYNFEKIGKKRQNIDFVVFDARYQDQFTQRMGRAGRVLGKAQVDTMSQAVALLPEEAANFFTQYEGQTLSRTEFKQILAQNEALPAQNALTGYISHYALLESFWPIAQLDKMLPDYLRDEIDQLIELVQDIFAPHSKWKKNRGSMYAYVIRYQNRKQWLQQYKKAEQLTQEILADKKTQEALDDWLSWVQPEEHNSWLEQHFSLDALRAFIQSQNRVTKSMFSFRDSFQGPSAVVYDPERLLSSQAINIYDIIHIVCNYHHAPLMSRRQFVNQFGDTDLRGDFYLKLNGLRQKRRYPVFSYQSELDQPEFEKQWSNSPVGLTGVELRVKEVGSDIVSGGLDSDISRALTEKPQTILILCNNDAWRWHRRLRNANLWLYDLSVRFPNATEEKYTALLGTAALIAYAEMKGYLYMKDRLKDEPIII